MTNEKNSEKSLEKTIIYSDYIESLNVDKDKVRWGFSSSIKPENFGEMSLKIQEKGQDHNMTEWRDI